MIERIELREVEQKEPTESIKKGIIYWGENNDYPYFLNSLYVNSAIHGGLVNSKVKRILGLGFNLPKEIDTNNGGTYSINEVVPQSVKDFEISNIFYLKLIKFGNGYIVSHEPYENVRVTTDGNFQISQNWLDLRKNKAENISNYFNDKNAEVSLIQFSETSPKYVLEDGTLSGSNYATPIYNGGITSIRTSIEIPAFNYSEIINSYKGGTLISLNNGVPKTNEEKTKIVNDLKNKATDKNKQGGLTIVFSDDKEHEATVSQMNGNNLPQRYQQTEINTIQNIMLAHSVSSPEIFGLIVSGALGGNSTREESEEAFKENYTNVRRNFVEQAYSFVLNNILKNNIEVKFIDEIVEDGIVSATDVDVASTALNGAQISSLVLVVSNVKQGLLDPIAGLEIIKSSFPTVDEATAKRMVGLEEQKFSKDYSIFEKLGVDKSKLKIHKSYSFNAKSVDLFEELKKDYYAISGDEKTILSMIANNEDFESIAKAIDVKPDKLVEIYQKLQFQGFLDDGFKLTPKGELNAISQEVTVMYTYEHRTDLPPFKDSTSREFCQTMMRLNKAYTRQEIDQITLALDVKSVWLYRGGWYHNPETNVNEPACRHEWQQHIILN
jgi:hypothetical protein